MKRLEKDLESLRKKEGKEEKTLGKLENEHEELKMSCMEKRNSLESHETELAQAKKEAQVQGSLCVASKVWRIAKLLNIIAASIIHPLLSLSLDLSFTSHSRDGGCNVYDVRSPYPIGDNSVRYSYHSYIYFLLQSRL